MIIKTANVETFIQQQEVHKVDYQFLLTRMRNLEKMVQNGEITADELDDIAILFKAISDDLFDSLDAHFLKTKPSHYLPDFKHGC